MNRETLWPRLRTLGIMLVLSVLTWIYAYRQLETSQEFRFTLKIVEPHGSRLAVNMLTNPVGGLVMRVSGSQRLLDQLGETLARNDSQLTYTLPGDTKPGIKTLSTREILRDLPQLSTARLDVDSADPSELRVEVDEYQTVEMPVSLDDDVLALRPPEPPVITPDRVQVTLPSRLYQSLSNVQRKVIARVNLEELKAAVTGDVVEYSKTVPLVADFRDAGHPITIEPKTASVQIRLQLHSRPIEGPVAVQIMGPKELWEKYAVELREPRETRLNLNVFLPPGMKGSLSAEKILAFVRLSAGDEPSAGPEAGTWREHEVEFVLPPGMRPAWETAPKVGLRLVPKGTNP